MKRPVLLLTFALSLAAGCSPSVRTGDYGLAEVPDLSTVGPAAYMAWFEANAVAPETVAFVESHASALEAAVDELNKLAASVSDA